LTIKTARKNLLAALVVIICKISLISFLVSAFEPHRRVIIGSTTISEL